MQFIGHFLLTGVLFALIDSFWLVVVANKFYKSEIGGLLLAKPKLGPAVLFYVIAIVGIVLFALNPALGAHSFSYALSHGALLGLVTYATYDLTNASTLKNWSSKVTIVDMVWGTFVLSAVTAISYAILH